MRVAGVLPDRALVCDEAHRAVVRHRQPLERARAAAGRRGIGVDAPTRARRDASRASDRQTIARSAPRRSRAWRVIASSTSRRSARPVSWSATSYSASRSRSRRWRLATVMPSCAAPATSPAMSTSALSETVGGDRRVEGEPDGAHAVHAADERQVQDPGVHRGPPGVSGDVERRVRRLFEDRPEPRHAGRERDGSLDAERRAVALVDGDRPGERPRLGDDPVEALLQQVGEREAAADRGADLVRGGEVPVVRDELLLRPVEVERDQGREHEDRRAHDHRRGEVGLVAGELRVDDGEPHDLEQPDEHERQHDHRPAQAGHVAGAGGVAHASTVPFDTGDGEGPSGPEGGGPLGPQQRARARAASPRP